MENKRCLVLLPIGVTQRREGPTFLALYEHLLLPALHATGVPLAVLRSDEVVRSGLSLHDGQQWLQDPHIIVADLTTRHSGVIHDLELRSFLAPRTIIISQQTEPVLRRFASYRHIVYTVSEAGINRLRHELRYHVRAICAATRAEALHR
jgi:hypothetical protein